MNRRFCINICMNETEDKRKIKMTLIAIIAMAGLIRFFRLGHQSLWVDELLTRGAYQTPEGVSYWEKILWDVHGPLYSLILYFWTMISDSEWWLRIPGAVAGVVSVYLIFKWINLYRSKTVALAGALIMAFNPYHLYYSQELRFYSLVIMMTLISLCLLKRFVDQPSYRNSIMLGMVMGLTCLSHLSGVFVCAALGLYLVLSGHLKGRYLLPAITAFTTAIVIVSPWIYREIKILHSINVQSITEMPASQKLRGELTLNPWSYPYVLYAFSSGYSFGPSLRELHMIQSPAELFSDYWLHMILVGVVFGLLVISGFYRLIKQGNFILPLLIVLVSLGSVTAAAMLNIKVFNVRYLSVMFPVFVILLAAGLPGRKVPRIVVLCIITAIMLKADWNYHMVSKYARDDIRGVSEKISSLEMNRDLIIAPGVRYFMDKFYYNGQNRVVEFSVYQQNDIKGKIGLYYQKYRRIWYVRYRPWYTDPEGLILDTISSGGTRLDSWSYPGIKLYLYTEDNHQLQ